MPKGSLLKQNRPTGAMNVVDNNNDNDNEYAFIAM